MPGRIARTETAARVADFLAARGGKRHLARYGWVPGMPIVMVRPSDSLNDAMAMLSIHGRAALMAMLDPENSDLRLLHITVPQKALKIAPASSEHRTVEEFVEQVAANGCAEFRVKFWQYTAVAHLIPSCEAMTSKFRAASRYPIAVSANSAAPFASTQPA